MGSDRKPRRLILMRHAKSDWSDSTQSDHARSLNPRGQRDAPRMAQWLLDTSMTPDSILCSTATRTRETLDLMQGVWEDDVEVAFDDRLYLAGPDTIAGCIAEVGGCSGTLMILSHNPGLSYLASVLAKESIELPTAAIAVFECDLDDWREFLDLREARLVQLAKPKELQTH